MKVFVLIKKLFNAFKYTIRKETFDCFQIFGWCSLGINNIPYLLWQSSSENQFIYYIRVFSGFVSIALIFEEYIFKSSREILSFFFIASVTFSLVVAPQVVYITHPDSLGWICHMIISIMFLPLLLNWAMVLIVCALGTTVSFIVASTLSCRIFISSEFLHPILYSHLALIAMTYIFVRRKQDSDVEKYKAYAKLSASLAHELHTPLATLNLASKNLSNLLLNNNERLNQTILLKGDDIEKICLNISRSVKKSFMISDIFRNNLRDRNTYWKGDSILSIKTCVTGAIDEYPLTSSEREKINYTPKEDFLFAGNRVMIENVFNNFIKNSLYYIKKHNRGEICISISTKGNQGIVTFMDTAIGVSDEELPHIFQDFYTTRENGTGLGLSFCREYIKRIGGKIYIESRFGEYLKLNIFLPIYKGGIQ